MQAATGTGYERLLARCEGLAPVPAAVAHPCEASALEAAVEAAEKGLIAPLLVGPAAKITEVLTSRADSVRSRIASCAVAKLVAHARRAKLEGLARKAGYLWRLFGVRRLVGALVQRRARNSAVGLKRRQAGALQRGQKLHKTIGA